MNIGWKTENQLMKILKKYPLSEELKNSYTDAEGLFAAINGNGYTTISVEDGVIRTARVSPRPDAYYKDLLFLDKGFDPKVIVFRKKLMDALARLDGKADNCIKLIKKNRHLMVAASTEENGKFSYARTKEDRYNSTRRVKTSFQKIMRKLGSEDPDHILSAIAGELFPIIWPCQVKELKGQDITRFYSTNSMSLRSCMTDKECTAMYAESPCASLAVVGGLGEGEGLARCLVFDTDQNDRVHSRIYFRSPEAKETLIAYFEERKIRDVYEESSSGVSVTFNTPEDKFIPYMDALRFTSDDPEESDTLTFSNSGDYCADNTGGNLSGLEHIRCYRCSDRCDDNYEFDGECYCEDCIEEVSVSCSHCSRRVGIDDSVCVDESNWCRRCADRNAHQCDRCGEWSETCTHQNLDNGEQWCESCLEDHTYVMCCEGYTENPVEVYGDMMCESCSENLKKEPAEEPKPEEPANLLAPPLVYFMEPDDAVVGNLTSFTYVPSEYGDLVIMRGADRALFRMPETFYVTCNDHEVVHAGWVSGQGAQYMYWSPDYNAMTVAYPASITLERI